MGLPSWRFFGSALTTGFEEDSDVDFLVDFSPGRPDPFEDSCALRDELREIVNRDVDLVVKRAIRNPYFRESALSQSETVYVADVQGLSLGRPPPMLAPVVSSSGARARTTLLAACTPVEAAMPLKCQVRTARQMPVTPWFTTPIHPSRVPWIRMNRGTVTPWATQGERTQTPMACGSQARNRIPLGEGGQRDEADGQGQSPRPEAARMRFEGARRPARGHAGQPRDDQGQPKSSRRQADVSTAVAGEQGGGTPATTRGHGDEGCRQRRGHGCVAQHASARSPTMACKTSVRAMKATAKTTTNTTNSRSGRHHRARGESLPSRWKGTGGGSRSLDPPW